ncbi:MAG: hypothetical protein KDB18_13795, partial [Salinibacterium sp.]|nr:hypothetical protein [Salinibacterium sp.]
MLSAGLWAQDPQIRFIDVRDEAPLEQWHQIETAWAAEDWNLAARRVESLLSSCTQDRIRAPGDETPLVTTHRLLPSVDEPGIFQEASLVLSRRLAALPRTAAE